MLLKWLESWVCCSAINTSLLKIRGNYLAIIWCAQCLNRWYYIKMFLNLMSIWQIKRRNNSQHATKSNSLSAVNQWLPSCQVQVNSKTKVLAENRASNIYYGSSCIMMTSSNGNIFRVTDHLCGEFTGHRWIPRTKACDAELWCLLWSAPA